MPKKKQTIKAKAKPKSKTPKTADIEQYNKKKFKKLVLQVADFKVGDYFLNSSGTGLFVVTRLSDVQLHTRYINGTSTRIIDITPFYKLKGVRTVLRPIKKKAIKLFSNWMQSLILAFTSGVGTMFMYMIGLVAFDINFKSAFIASSIIGFFVFTILAVHFKLDLYNEDY